MFLDCGWKPEQTQACIGRPCNCLCRVCMVQVPTGIQIRTFSLWALTMQPTTKFKCVLKLVPSSVKILLKSKMSILKKKNTCKSVNEAKLRQKHWGLLTFLPFDINHSPYYCFMWSMSKILLGISKKPYLTFIYAKHYLRN